MRTTSQPLNNETKPLTFLLVLTVLFLFTSSCSDNIQNAHDAYNKKDYKEAHKLFLSLATDGVAQAQNNLGWMYSQGQGVPKDSVSVHMWFSVAASNGNKDAVKNRNMLVEQMTPQQIEKAQEMARNWKPKK